MLSFTKIRYGGLGNDTITYFEGDGGNVYSSVGHRLVPASLELGMLQDLGYHVDYSKQYKL